MRLEKTLNFKLIQAIEENLTMYLLSTVKKRPHGLDDEKNKITAIQIEL